MQWSTGLYLFSNLKLNEAAKIFAVKTLYPINLMSDDIKTSLILSSLFPDAAVYTQYLFLFLVYKTGYRWINNSVHE